MSFLTDIIVPVWARWVAILALAGTSYAAGCLHEARHESAAQAAKVITVVKHEVQTVVQVQTVYKDRIQKIYIQEKAIEADIPRFIPPSVDAEFAVPVGFVRVASAGWTGDPPGPAGDADREPSGVQFSELAAAEASNAASCRIWREQALGWRAFYAKQQETFNGRHGDWFRVDAGPSALGP
jgi:hypothetical protein